MAVAEAKEPRIAGRTAIRVLKQHMVKEPNAEVDLGATQLTG